MLDNNISKQEKLKSILILIISIVFVLAFMGIFKFNDYKTLNQIKENVIRAEMILEGYMSDQDGLPEGHRVFAETNIETKLSEKRVFNSEGLVANIDLDKEYYRVPGIVNVAMNSKLDGYFICDKDGNVFYVHNRKLKISRK